MPNDSVLDLPLLPNDAGAKTIRDYLVTLLEVLWQEGESFSGKRPLGNSDWMSELTQPIINAGLARDFRAASTLVEEAIQRLR